MGWKQIRELYKNGNEIAAHGYYHIKYGKYLPVEKLRAQMTQIKELIENELKTTVYTIHYPYSFTSDSIVSAAKKTGFLFGRTADMNFNNANDNNLYLIKSQPIINNNNPSTKTFVSWLQQAKGKWLVLMYHHLFPEKSKEMNILRYHKVKNTYSLLPDTFNKQIEILSKTDYWKAPIYQIGMYIYERKNTTIKSHRICKTFKIKTKTVADTTKYTQALTMQVRLPWQKVLVKRSLKDGIYKVKDNLLLIDFKPGKTIIIKKIK